MDYPGLNVSDGLPDHLTDPVDVPVRLLRLLVEFAVGRPLMGRVHPFSHVSLVGDPPEGISPSSSPEAPEAATSCTEPG